MRRLLFRLTIGLFAITTIAVFAAQISGQRTASYIFTAINRDQNLVKSGYLVIDLERGIFLEKAFPVEILWRDEMSLSFTHGQDALILKQQYADGVNEWWFYHFDPLAYRLHLLVYERIESIRFERTIDSYHPTWSQTDRLLAYVVPSTNELRLVDLETLNEQVVGQVPDLRRPSFGIWSPDNSRVVLPTSDQLVVADRGENTVNLFMLADNNPSDMALIQWSGDGLWILVNFLGASQTEHEINILNANDGDSHYQLANLSGTFSSWIPWCDSDTGTFYEADWLFLKRNVPQRTHLLVNPLTGEQVSLDALMNLSNEIDIIQVTPDCQRAILVGRSSPSNQTVIQLYKFSDESLLSLTEDANFHTISNQTLYYEVVASDGLTHNLYQYSLTENSAPLSIASFTHRDVIYWLPLITDSSNFYGYTFVQNGIRLIRYESDADQMHYLNPPGHFIDRYGLWHNEP
jgi:hypothetical protein